MRSIKPVVSILLMVAQSAFAQQVADNKIEINGLIESYSKSVIEKDSTAFYSLFNDGTVTWCAALKNRSQAREAEKKGDKRSHYLSGSYKGFFKGLYKYEATEDKFDNVWIAEDGTVASVMMDYSFHANRKMTNWGNKYLTLIKREGKWKIVSVVYSLELTEYFSTTTIGGKEEVEENGQKLADMFLSLTTSFL